MRGLVEDAKKTKLNNNNNNSVTRAKSGMSSTTSAASSSSRQMKGVIKTPTTATTTSVGVKKTPQSMQQQVGKSTKSAASSTAMQAAATTTGTVAATTTATTTASSSNAKTATAKAQKGQNQPQQQSTTAVTVTPTVAPASAPAPVLPPQSSQQQQQQQLQPYNNNSNTIALPKASHANTNEELAGGVQDTIYLCNFRVSVDGEWLCLKELQDIDVAGGVKTVGGGAAALNVNAGNSIGNSIAAAAGGGNSMGISNVQSSRHQQSNHQFGQRNKRYSGLSTAASSTLEDNGIMAIENLIGRRLCDVVGSNALAAPPHQQHKNVGLIGGTLAEWSHLSRDTAEIERSNLVNICKLVVKELLEQSLRYGRMLDSDHLPLQHFFIVIEHVLGHGLRPKKGLLGPRKELWDLLQSVENYCPEAQDITASVRDLPTVRTHIGRARAWLRIALMQKKLSDYLQALIEHRDDSLLDYYEPHALMMSDEIVVIMGILVGLNVIDCNLCVKEEDLDSQQGVIDFSLYLRSSSRNAEPNEESSAPPAPIDAAGQGNMIAVLDQKNYIEELNRHLNATVANLQAKVESLTTTNALMKEDLAIARNSLLALQAENQAMRQSASQTAHSDNSSNGSSSDKEKAQQFEAVNAELSEERRRTSELDKELKLQVSLKAESDMAMKLLEKDIHEKQDTIVSLRRQLDDIKQINLEMYRKLQECEDELTQKGEMVSRLQTKASQIGNILQSLEKKYESKLVEQQQVSAGCSSSSSGGGDRSPNTRRQQNLQKFEALTKKHKQDTGPPMKRLHLKMDGIPPFNPNNYRKSPANAAPPPPLEQQSQLLAGDAAAAAIKTPTSAKSLNDELAEAAAAVTQHFKIGGDGSRSDYALSQDQETTTLGNT
ncbi:LOW QUALITY PROTEIN: FYVE and coiled-coil domain-containing protein 1 [Drosophila nasuta]|uniref:LOW QUALITY PROTEIN: FYVE and coiled-coil domain-containing protein 1 n=1 Tax=Drosophila nasuta TaxID=42062 RepID=UPI00295F17FC|nr:LOW QUALITY PROTEIN: FYVE and coiled-coil domain-containing protein 1 [Drosophila nasuta]